MTELGFFPYQYSFSISLYMSKGGRKNQSTEVSPQNNLCASVNTNPVSAVGGEDLKEGQKVALGPNTAHGQCDGIVAMLCF